MKNDYLISIIGNQIIDSEENQVSMSTLGSYYKKGNNKYIFYKEHDSNISKNPITSVLKIEGDNKATLIKYGKQQSRLILEENCRHMCNYDTGFGTLMIGVFTNKINCNLNDNGGNLNIKYSLDINSTLTSINKIHINIRENKK